MECALSRRCPPPAPPSVASKTSPADDVVMSSAAGSGLALSPSPDDAALEASLAALAAAGTDHADLAMVFVTADSDPRAHELLHAIRRVTGARSVIGCSGVGVLTEQREVEGQNAVAVLVVKDDRLRATPFL